MSDETLTLGMGVDRQLSTLAIKMENIERLNAGSNPIWYCESRNILFPCILKNASTTLSNYCSQHPELFREIHCDRDVNQDELHQVGKSNPTVCTILRDPFARFISAAAMFGAVWQYEFGLNVALDDFEYLNTASDSHFMPQFMYVAMYNLVYPNTTVFNGWDGVYDIYTQNNVLSTNLQNHKFFYMTEDPNEDVVKDIIEYFNFPKSDGFKSNTYGSEIRVKHKLSSSDIKKWLKVFNLAYNSDYDLLARVNFVNKKGS